MTACHFNTGGYAMDTRSQFTFYDSFYRAVSHISDPVERCLAYEAIISYALYAQEPNMSALPTSVAIVFDAARPNLDTSRRKSTVGKKGGRHKSAVQTQDEQKPVDSQPEKQDDSCFSSCETKNDFAFSNAESKDKIEDKVKDKDKIKTKTKEKNKCYSSGGSGGPPTPHAAATEEDSPASAVIAHYRQWINPDPSDSCLQALCEFSRSLSSEVCMRSIDEAVDAGKPFWAYIRAILQDKVRRGITSLDKWPDPSPSRSRQRPAGTAAEETVDLKKNAQQLQRLREKMRGEGGME
jgi:hypothetical protein